jgi:chromosomal replication initiation ATPase DnaA
MSTTRQLPLPFPHRPGFSPADFLAAPSNRQALAWLERTRGWPDRRLALWGEAGCGKTHLLHVWAERHGALIVAAGDVPEKHPLPAAPAFAIDAAELLAEGSLADETALLHLLNAAREAGAPVLLAARTPPGRWPLRLPDLASRLRATTAVEIEPPEESLLRALLMRLLADRQLTISPELQEWLLRRLPRTPAALRQAAALLDQAALAAGGRISRALAARALAGLLANEETDQEGGMTSEPSSTGPGFL